jgi:outer membrane biogenesis lipoprotein LolB
MKRSIVLFLLFIAGCSTVPFQETKPVFVGSEDPRQVVERHQKGIPASFQLLTSVVFEYNSRKFSGIGTVRINRPEGVFRVAGMNPMGVKLFELSGDQQRVTSNYTIADFSRYGDIAAAVGNDIRRIYFDLVPGPEASIWKRKYKLIFRQPSGPGFLEFVFAGTGGDLIEKNYYEADGIVWKVSYYEYHDQDGMRWPQGIVLIHYQYGYRLIVRQKEFIVEHN